MGKGQTACLSSFSGALSGIALEETRARWGSTLSDQLDELLAEALLVDEAQAIAERDRLLGLYRSGAHPDWWMHDFRAAFRLRLAALIAEEQSPRVAFEMLRSPDIGFEQRSEALLNLLEMSGSPDEKSVVRHALAELYFTGGLIDQARDLLREDFQEPDLNVRRSSLSGAKLAFLSSFTEPVCWEERLIPPIIREQRSDHWHAMQELGLGEKSGYEAGSYFAHALAREGFSEQALELCDRLDAHQWTGRGVEAAGRSRFNVLSLLGRQDQHLESLSEPFAYRLSELDRVAERMMQDGRLEEAEGFRLLARQVAKFEFDSVPLDRWAATKRALVLRLVEDGCFADALLIAEAPRLAYDSTTDEEYKLIILAAAADSDPDAWLSQLKGLVESPGFSFSRLSLTPPSTQAKHAARRLLNLKSGGGPPAAP